MARHSGLSPAKIVTVDKTITKSAVFIKFNLFLKSESISTENSESISKQQCVKQRLLCIADGLHPALQKIRFNNEPTYLLRQAFVCVALAGLQGASW
jgi:cephalosporin hydroxylase